MKKTIRFILLTILIFSMVFTASVSASDDSISLYEKYGYNEDFEYNDEMAGHALKTSVVYVGLTYEATVRYQPVEFNEDQINEEFDILCDEFSYLDKAEIAGVLLDYAKENILSYLYWGGTEKIDVELGAHGSGVVISEDGYIATNAHVVTLTDEDKEKACIEYLQSYVLEDIVNVFDLLEQTYGISFDDDEKMALYETGLELTTQKCTISNKKESLYVSFPSASGDTDYDKDRTFKAKVVEKGVPMNVDNEGATQDAAILKIDEENLVALSLSDSYPEANSKIITAGFPGAAETIFQQMGSDKSILSVSIGTGNISRQIAIKGHDYKALEITTTISNGNSGGPSVDSGLKIEGLNTYGLSSDMRFAYMIPAEYVSDLAKGIELEQEEVSKTFLTGLQMLQSGYGAAAKECFEYVKEQREDTPYIENLITLAEKAPQEYPKTKFNIEDYLLYIIIGGGVLLVIITVIIIVIVSKRKKKKRLKESVTISSDSAEIQSTEHTSSKSSVVTPSAESEPAYVNNPSKFCSNCGAKLNTNTKFCSSCGKEQK